MNTLLKAFVVALPVILLAACSKQEAQSDAASGGDSTAGTQAVSAADESSDQEFSGELAAPADEMDFQSADTLTAEEYAAAVAGDLPAGAADLTQAAQESAQSPAGSAAASEGAPASGAATAKATVATEPPRATLEESKILAEKQGQWASTAKASSSYRSDPKPKAPYSAWQATGAPNVPTYSDHPDSWAPKSGDAAAPEWLEVGFAKPVHGSSIRVRQNAAPGAIAKIELIDEAGGLHGIWEGTDTTPYEKNVIGWFVADFPQTAYKVKGARITLATSRVWGWNEIDAVQLVGKE